MADAEIEPKPVDQDALVADIDRTRTELARTIDAIADRVSPKKNADRAMQQVRLRVAQIDPVMAGAAAAAVWYPAARPGSAGALGQLFVFGGGQQVRRQRRVPVAVGGHPHPEHPAGAVGLGVDQ